MTEIAPWLVLAASVVFYGLGLWLVLARFLRLRAKVAAASESTGIAPIPAWPLHFLPPAVIGALYAIGAARGKGDDLGPLLALGCAAMIIQLVCGGMVGLGRSWMAVGVTLAFIAVEVGFAAVLFAAFA